MSLYAVLSFFLGPLSTLINSNQVIQNAYIASDRLFDIIDVEAEQESGVEITEKVSGEIVFENVSFRYGSRHDVFKELNLNIKCGAITAIVGDSGSGKSTLIHLLQNIYPISSGSVRINNLELSQIDNSSLRRVVGVVPQSIELFKGTICDNIALGEIEPDIPKVMAACKEVGFGDYLQKMEKGIFSEVGEDGANLSGGQRQKIAFARVLYRDPEIIIMDEATSSLDSISEGVMMKAVDNLRKNGKTVIMIAHRLSTLLSSDTIIVLEEGKVVEQGNHKELYESRGKYFALWQKQLPLL